MTFSVFLPYYRQIALHVLSRLEWHMVVIFCHAKSYSHNVYISYYFWMQKMYRILLSLPFSLRSSDRPIDCLKGKTVEQFIVIYNELCFVHSTQLPVSVTQLWRFSFLFYNLTKNTFLQILLLLLQLKSERIILFLTDKQKHNSARIHRKCPSLQSVLFLLLPAVQTVPSTALHHPVRPPWWTVLGGVWN